MNTIIVPSEKIPVIAEVDICVIGGSCTGVFAAVRAARLGAKVAIIEKQNRFGGVATSALVNMWHSIYNTEYEKQIIGGLTYEVMERLERRNAVAKFKDSKVFGVPFNSEELTIELDELALESNLKIFFHTSFSGAITQNGKVSAVIIQNKSGRGAIKADFFIDASGDADLCRNTGLTTYLPSHIQPPTTCAKFTSFNSGSTPPYKVIAEHMKEYGMPEGILWGTFTPPSEDIYMLNGTRVTGRNPADADDLTFCEMEGRRQLRAITDIIRKYSPDSKMQLAALPSYIGIRETYHIKAQHQLKGSELLAGTHFTDAIANGTYPVDIHHQDKPGITFFRLDGFQDYCRPGHPNERSRWREETATNQTYYQIPLRCLIPENSQNVICAGRMLDADQQAFGAVRVMVNLNQTGEAAGVAAFSALSNKISISDVNPSEVRKLLSEGGSCII